MILRYFTIFIATAAMFALWRMLITYGPFVKQGVVGLRQLLTMCAGLFIAVCLQLLMYLVPQHPALQVFALAMLVLSVAMAAMMAQIVLTIVGEHNRIEKVLLRLMNIPIILAVFSAITNHHYQLLMLDATKSDGFFYAIQFGPMYMPLSVINACMLAFVLLYCAVITARKSREDKQLVIIAGIVSTLPTLLLQLELLVFKRALNISNLFTWVTVWVLLEVFYGFLLTTRTMALESSGQMYVSFDRWGNCIDQNQSARAFCKEYMGEERPSREQFLARMQDAAGAPREGGAALPPNATIEMMVVNHKKQEKRIYQMRPFTVSRSINKYCATGYLINEITEMREQMDELSELATLDALTGVKNRRFFEKELAELLQKYARRRECLSLLMLDIDHFKRVNDTYGHAVGDRVLQELAGVCTESLRQGDVLCRIGGEEFMVLLPNEVSPMAGRQVAARLQQAVEQHAFLPHSHRLYITVSIGAYTAVPGAQSSPDEWFAKVDGLLYKAKAEGRNRVAFYAEPETWAAGGEGVPQ